MTPSLRDTEWKLLFRAIGCLLTGSIGLLLLLPFGRGLQNLSLDMPFCFRSRLEATNAVIVYLNTGSLQAVVETNGPVVQETFVPPLRTDFPPDRRIYGRLLKMMRAEGALLVFFDLDFSSERPGEDGPFAQAIMDNGPAILGGTYDDSSVRQAGSDAGAAILRIRPPNDALGAAAKEWGLLKANTGERARQIFLGDDQRAAAILVAARMNGFKGDARAARWLNFYGPPYSIDHVLLTEALNPEKSGQFRNRAVFVGGGDPLNPRGGGADLHPTPYSAFGGPETTGVEILATGYLNLVQSDWLKRVPYSVQAIIMACWGLAALAFFLCFRPRYALLLMPALMLVAVAAGFYSQ
jgi:CHASE2 domain-containing sensor protein